ncbi:hypothetical protein Fleli_0761 [Bernardetia litoralis DSM 6794]|uniref:Uncharacterized protein n=1 Tax=Bernardetia litoralis (strain ATCC 23117 / DSM 6794 / NBRC 15988 / NCIMB 1366 / Fx l1 / Sio-4) TaxID=880071 RepID=I4AGY6_BERLS|nr:hypothetical protein [Bernardetia litoralis]AFM03221.1 hypothetical protein Fleli_0761 [Bernardetia litoralis DSM 6794]
MDSISEKKNLPQKQNNQGITWKTDFWTQKTSILYNRKEIGFFKMNIWKYKRAKGMLLDREFQIKPINFWGTKVVIIDKIDERIIATISTDMWSGRTELYVEKDNETFIFKQNMWSTGNWWWERKLSETEKQEQKKLAIPNEKLVHNSISNFLTGEGKFNFGNTGESNLNALILGGIFIMKMRQQAAG